MRRAARLRPWRGQVSSFDPNEVKVQEKINEVKVYLRWHRFPPALSARVKRYFEFYFSRNSAMDEAEILAHLAPTLRRLVLHHLLSRSVMRIPIFSEERSYVTVELCHEVRTRDSGSCPICRRAHPRLCPHGGSLPAPTPHGSSLPAPALTAALCPPRPRLRLSAQVHSKIRPLLREANENIMESLEKGAPGDLSVYFVRRGTISALASLPEVSFFDIDAGTVNGCGAIIGEHALMTKTQGICSYRAMTRCELYSLAVDDLYAIAQRLKERDPEDVRAPLAMPSHRPATAHSTRARVHVRVRVGIDMVGKGKGRGGGERRGGLIEEQCWWDGHAQSASEAKCTRATHRCRSADLVYARCTDDEPAGRPSFVRTQVNEIADIIYTEFTRRHLIRALTLRLVVAMQTPLTRCSAEGAGLREDAALRLQVRWIHRNARRMVSEDLDSDAIALRMPGLFSRARQKARNAGQPAAHDGQAMDRRMYRRSILRQRVWATNQSSFRPKPWLSSNQQLQLSGASAEPRAESPAGAGPAEEAFDHQSTPPSLDTLVGSAMPEVHGAAATPVGAGPAEGAAPSSEGSGPLMERLSKLEQTQQARFDALERALNERLERIERTLTLSAPGPSDAEHAEMAAGHRLNSDPPVTTTAPAPPPEPAPGHSQAMP